jgi:hypothetical protein
MEDTAMTRTLFPDPTPVTPSDGATNEQTAVLALIGTTLACGLAMTAIVLAAASPAVSELTSANAIPWSLLLAVVVLVTGSLAAARHGLRSNAASISRVYGNHKLAGIVARGRGH